MSCDLFERDGLLQLQHGIRLDAHFDTCPDCRAARRVYAQLGERLAELDIEAAPSPAWKAHVWARIDQQRQSGSLAALTPTRATVRANRKLVRWFAPSGAIATFALVAWLAWLSGLRSNPGVAPPATPPTVSLTAEIYSGQTSMRRGEDAHPGDQLHVAANTGAYQHAELRVYFNDKEVAAQCSADTPCKRNGNTIAMRTTMRSVGSYRPLLIVSNGSIPAAVSGLDQDAAAAMSAGATVKAGDPIPVR